MMKVARVKRSRGAMASWDMENIWYSIAFGDGLGRLKRVSQRSQVDRSLHIVNGSGFGKAVFMSTICSPAASCVASTLQKKILLLLCF